MANMAYTEGFLNDAAAIWSPSARDYLLRALRAIEMFPEVGSADIPETIRERYGTAVRKMAIRPFDLVYEHDRESDVVYVHALIPFRQVR